MKATAIRMIVFILAAILFALAVDAGRVSEAVIK